MASVARRLRRNVTSGRSVAPGLRFRATSTLRLKWAQFVTLPLLERRFETWAGLTRDEYKFYERKAATVRLWQEQTARRAARARP